MNDKPERTLRLAPQFHQHLHSIEHTFAALESGERLRERDPERGMVVMREAIRRAAATFAPAALEDMRPLLLHVAFWCPNAAAALLPVPGEGWLEGFFAFLIGLRRILLAALAALADAPATASTGGVPQPAPQAGAVTRPMLLGVRAAAAMLGLTEKGTRHQIDAGKLPVVRRGRRVFVNIKALERQVDAGTEFRA